MRTVAAAFVLALAIPGVADATDWRGAYRGSLTTARAGLVLGGVGTAATLAGGFIGGSASGYLNLMGNIFFIAGAPVAAGSSLRGARALRELGHPVSYAAGTCAWISLAAGTGAVAYGYVEGSFEALMFGFVAYVGSYVLSAVQVGMNQSVARPRGYGAMWTVHPVVVGGYGSTSAGLGVGSLF